jgi:hypothetical protein
VSIPKQASIWDARRNTSAVFQPNPTALADAQRALAHFRATQPELHRWIADGYPALTEAEHVARFGAPYNRRKP